MIDASQHPSPALSNALKLEVDNLLSQGSPKLCAVISVSVRHFFKVGLSAPEIADMVFEGVLSEFGGKTISIPQNRNKKIEDRNNEIVRLYEQGFSARAIIKEIDISSSVVYEVLSEREIPLRRRKKPVSQCNIYRQEDYEERFSKGLTPDRISKELQVLRSTVLGRLRAIRSANRAGEKCAS